MHIVFSLHIKETDEKKVQTYLKSLAVKHLQKNMKKGLVVLSGEFFTNNPSKFIHEDLYSIKEIIKIDVKVLKECRTLFG